MVGVEEGLAVVDDRIVTDEAHDEIAHGGLRGFAKLADCLLLFRVLSERFQ